MTRVRKEESAVWRRVLGGGRRGGVREGEGCLEEEEGERGKGNGKEREGCVYLPGE